MNKTKIIKDLPWIITSFLLLFVIALQIYTIASFNEKDIYRYIENSLIVEVLNEDDTKTKGTAIFVSDTQAITVAHLFEKEFTSINLYFYGSQIPFTATIGKQDNDIDLALLNFEKQNIELNNIDFAEKEEINFGDEIIKIGNALGYGLSVNKGIVSTPYIKLEINEVEREMIGISITIMSGDSGGGVFATNNKLLGLISFKTTPISANDSLSFIVPSYIIENFLK